eukprot:gene50145-56204_t
MAAPPSGGGGVAPTVGGADAVKVKEENVAKEGGAASSAAGRPAAASGGDAVKVKGERGATGEAACGVVPLALQLNDLDTGPADARRAEAALTGRLVRVVVRCGDGGVRGRVCVVAGLERRDGDTARVGALRTPLDGWWLRVDAAGQRRCVRAAAVSDALFTDDEVGAWAAGPAAPDMGELRRRWER